MRKNISHSIKFFEIFLTVFIIASFLFPVSLQASVMPGYERLQPVTGGIDAPGAVALDAYENLYVAESINNRVLIYSQSGRYLDKLSGLARPISVAVDGSGRIYVGNGDRGNVEVYDSDLSLLYRLGFRDSEFKEPGAIAIDSGGSVYVADSGKDEIRVYRADGTYNFSFRGGSAVVPTPEGMFNSPIAIAIDEARGEIIILDLQADDFGYGPQRGARVQVFDMDNGFSFLRSFGEFGQGEGKLFKPKGVVVDEEGRIYVTDSYQNVVQVFDGAGLYLGTIYDLETPMRTALGIALGASHRLFIASLNASRVDVYGLIPYTQMEVTPLKLFFEGQEGGVVTEVQDIEITNKGSGALNWTAGTNEGWIEVIEPSGVTEVSGVSAVGVGVNIGGLAAGEYTGSVEVSAESGATESVGVTLTVMPLPPELSVTPSSLEFVSVQGAEPSPQVLSIDNTGGGELKWTGLSDAEWLLIDKGAGTAPDTVNVSVEISSLSEGTYNGGITISGEGAAGSPVTVPVRLDIIRLKGGINVTTNLQEATFTINGPESYSGSGTSWSVSGVLIGTYTIVYGEVAGYTRPASESLSLEAGGVINFSGEYKEEVQAVVRRSIIVGAGSGKKNRGIVKVINPDGTAGVEFTAHRYRYGVEVAAGDLDGDGTDEIITAPGPGKKNPAEINIFDSGGNPLAGLSIIAGPYKYGAYVAGGDLDGDGRSEVIVGAGGGSRNPAEVKVFVYDEGGLKDSGIDLLAYNTGYGVRVAAGDVDGDGIDEIITAPGAGRKNRGVIKIWKVDSSLGTGQWSTTFYKEFTVVHEYEYTHGVSVGSGDIDGDGVDEIITGAGFYRKLPGPYYRRASDIISIFDEDGRSISEFRADFGYRGVNVAGGDVDGDGVAEVVAGNGAWKRNEGVVKVFDAYGVEKSAFENLSRGYGVNVGTGNLGFEVIE